MTLSRGVEASFFLEASAGTGKRKHTCTLGERLQRWRKTALFESGKRFQQVILVAPFFELVAELLFPAAVKVLQREDWAEIDARLDDRRDPLFNPVVEEKFHTLQETILRWEQETEKTRPTTI